MREQPTNICPLLVIAADSPAGCLEDRCAWYDGQLCAIMSLSFSLEELAEDKKTARGATNTTDGKAEME